MSASDCDKNDPDTERTTLEISTDTKSFQIKDDNSFPVEQINSKKSRLSLWQPRLQELSYSESAWNRLERKDISTGNPQVVGLLKISPETAEDEIRVILWLERKAVCDKRSELLLAPKTNTRHADA